MHALKRRRTTIRNTLFAGVAVIALSAAVPNAPKAQDYTFYGFVEGRYLMSFGDPTDVGFGQVYCPYLYGSCTVDTAESETDDGVGGKVKIGYRTSGAWDVAIAGSGGRLDGDQEPVTAGYYFSSTVYADAEGDAESETQYAIADFEIGYNVGIGWAFEMGSVGSQLFIESRYHSIDMSPQSTEILPITIGYRW